MTDIGVTERKFQSALAGDTVARQRAASAPQTSAWVVANAGSGKTHILTLRVVRLLLGGVNPATLLCLTFTRAAAAEMSNRIFGLLARWTRCPEPELDAEIAEMTGAPAGPRERARARILFAEALQTPGGLRIQTIHAFCERILHQFPFEADIPGRFSILDEDAARNLVEQAQAAIWAQYSDRVPARGPGQDDPVAASIRYLSITRADPVIDLALADFIRRRNLFAQWKSRLAGPGSAHSIDAVIADLAARLGLAEGEDEAGLARDFLGTSLSLIDRAPDLLAALAAHPGPTNDKAARFLRRMADDLHHPTGTEAERAATRCGFYLKADGEAYAPASRATKAVRGRFDDFNRMFLSDADLCRSYRERLNAMSAYRSTQALLRVGDAVLNAYDELKRGLSALDYDDLIAKTRDLLTRADAALWVKYKLDSGIAHILVDEAQDTNPAQWAIVRALSEEFFSGEGAAPGPRTVFAVGDEKQSIFAFQGADPRMMADMRTEYSRRALSAGRPFIETPLATSFRSTPEILAAVDATFQGELQELVTRAPYEPHRAFRQADLGKVTIWPRLVRQSQDPPEDWTEPYDAPTRVDMALAAEIADEIERLLSVPDGLPSGRPVTPGEILILVRKRDAFAKAMNRELKRRGLPSAGSDRIALTTHIITQDLLALGDVMLLPDDDLQLAALLKSPLLDLDDDDLMALAPERGTRSLWSQLDDSSHPHHRRAAGSLGKWRALAGQVAPFEFYATLLCEGARAAFRARFGHEADDVLDLFMSEILNFEADEPATLQGLLAHIRGRQTDIRREIDESAAAIRLMTVHGAKGLEADTVFLVDTGGEISPPATRDPLLVVDPEPGSAGAPALIWRQGGPDTNRVQRAAEEREDREARGEYYRLLYVAMTRARDQLSVCGIRNTRTPNGSWYDCIARSLLPQGQPRNQDGELAAPFDWPPHQPDPAEKPAIIPPSPAPSNSSRPSSDQPSSDRPSPDRPSPDRPSSKQPATGDDIAAPAWLTTPAPSSRDIVESALTAAWADPTMQNGYQDRLGLEPDGGRQSRDPAGSGQTLSAAERGIEIHRLLERLPAIDPENREAAAHALLMRRVPGASIRREIVNEVLGVLTDRRIAPWFGPGSRAEIAISGTIPRQGRVHALTGRIDRIWRTDNRLAIIDFKTGLDCPQDPREIPAAYVAQLALYRHFAALVDPGRSISAHLVWTREREVIDLSGDAMDRALASLGMETAAGA